jgi:hypothetical protein
MENDLRGVVDALPAPRQSADRREGSNFGCRTVRAADRAGRPADMPQS